MMNSESKVILGDCKLMRKIDVARRLAMSERALQRLVVSKAFPAPVRLGRQAYWIEPVVARWIDAQLHEQRIWLESQAMQPG